MKKYIKHVVSILLVLALIVSLSVTSFADTTWRNRVASFQAISAANYSSYTGYVKAAQRFLQLYSYDTHELIMNNGGIDGIFGSKTRDAVIKFQTLTNLDPDGVVGTNTWGKMYDIMTQNNYSSTEVLFYCYNYYPSESGLSQAVLKATYNGSTWGFCTANSYGLLQESNILCYRS